MAGSWKASRIVGGALAVLMLGSGVLLYVPGVSKGVSALLFFGCCGAVMVLKRTHPQLWQRPPERVEINAQGVQRILSSGKREWAAWSELTEVWIVTTSDGPFLDDFFFVLIAGEGSGCAVPSTQAGDLLARLQRLPRFDNTQVILASGCTEEARFVCWKGAPGEALAAAL